MVLFVLVMGIGAGLTLWCWPATRSLHDEEFWAWLLGIPGICYGTLFSLRYGLFQYAKMKTHIHNEVREQGLRIAIGHAQRPLILLEVAYTTALGADRVAERVVGGESVLETNYVEAAQAHVRHSILAEHESDPDADASESTRRSAAIRMGAVFEKLLEHMTDVLKSLPPRLPLDVYLSADSSLVPEGALSEWTRIWRQFGLREASVEHATTGHGVMELDRSLDSAGGAARATLVVAAQLHDIPTLGSTEAGVALLFVSPAAAQRIGLTQTTTIHRPVEGTIDNIGQVFESALQWGNLAKGDIGSLWQSGTNGAAGAAILAAWANAGKDAREIHEIDSSLGQAGVAADWLGVALASEYARETGQPQLVASQQHDLVRMAMIK